MKYAFVLVVISLIALVIAMFVLIEYLNTGLGKCRDVDCNESCISWCQSRKVNYTQYSIYCTEMFDYCQCTCYNPKYLDLPER